MYIYIYKHTYVCVHIYIYIYIYIYLGLLVFSIINFKELVIQKMYSQWNGNWKS